MLKRKITVLGAFIRKEKRLEINNLHFHLKKFVKEEIKIKVSRRIEIKDTEQNSNEI